MFLVPVKREDGSFFNMVSQMQDGKYCLLTFVDQYRANPLTAPPYMTISFFDELLSTKQIGLLRADVISADISKNVGQRVVKYLREFYTDPRKFQYVKTFNLRPNEFHYQDFKNSFPEFF